MREDQGEGRRSEEMNERQKREREGKRKGGKEGEETPYEDLSSVLTSMMVWPRKSSLSLVSFCRSFDLMSLSSSHTRTLILSLELWHSLQPKGVLACGTGGRRVAQRWHRGGNGVEIWWQSEWSAKTEATKVTFLRGVWILEARFDTWACTVQSGFIKGIPF